MKWNNFKENKPPLDQPILIGGFRQDFEKGKENVTFEWNKGFIIRPYDLDDKYNPDYYTYQCYSYQLNEMINNKVPDDFFWSLIEIPEKNNE